MMQKIQRFGGAMYTPAILFAFSGIVVGLGTLFTTEAIFGEMATAGHLWFDCWNVLLQGGWTLFNQMPLLFCVALPISLANKQNARCCMEALAIYLTFNYFVSKDTHAKRTGGKDESLEGRDSSLNMRPHQAGDKSDRNHNEETDHIDEHGAREHAQPLRKFGVEVLVVKHRGDT